MDALRIASRRLWRLSGPAWLIAGFAVSIVAGAAIRPGARPGRFASAGNRPRVCPDHAPSLRPGRRRALRARAAGRHRAGCSRPSLDWDTALDRIELLLAEPMSAIAR